MTEPPNVAVVGPTASGKSELAVQLAVHLRAEVVNADSMQVYRGMNIGTAKLSQRDQGAIKHHLLDVWPVTKTASLAEYQHLALAAIAEMNMRRTTALLVGGSGMYVQAVVDEWDIPGTDSDIRSRLEGELATVGVVAMHERLTKLDPQAAAAILPSNERRIVRALEVIEMQGSFTASLPSPTPSQRWVLVGLDVDRDVLDARIETRVRGMWKAGFVEEVRALQGQGLRRGVTASRALGYAQVLRFLDGELSEDEAMHQTVMATRRFVRRQQSWFRRDKRVSWLPVEPGKAGGALLNAALGVIETTGA